MGGEKMEQQLFTKGSQVEVSSDDEGFKGAWYVATVVKPASNSPSKKDKSKKRNRHTKYLVQYETLLEDDDGSKPLREYVDVSFIRPLPPEPTHEDTHYSFELNDVVDASFRDGWWTGSVTRVVEDGSRFVISFQNPPDEIEFVRSDLRIHRDWVNGKWVRPEKQRTMGVMFSTGTAVEVSFDGENFRDVWFLSIVRRETGNNTFLVECRSSGIGDETGICKVTVDSLHIRPSPPRLEDKDLLLLEKVDTFYDFGWWSGVITKILQDRRYVVLINHTKREKELGHNELRPHMDWIDGKWSIASQDVVGYTCCGANEKKLKRATSNRDAIRPLKKLREGNAVETTLSITPCKHKTIPAQTLNRDEPRGLASPATGGTGTDCSKRLMVGDQLSGKTESTLRKKDEINEAKDGNSIQTRKRGRPRKLRVERQLVSVEGIKKLELQNEADLPTITEMGFSERSGTLDEYQIQLSSKEYMNLLANDKKLLGSRHRHDDILSNILKMPLEKDKRQNQIVVQNIVKRPKKYLSNGRGRRNTTSESAIQDAQDVSEGKSSGMNSETEDVEIVIDKMPNDIFDEQHLLTWLEGMRSQTIVDDSSVLPVRTPSQCAEASDKQDENQALKQCAEASDGQDENQALKQCAKANDGQNENQALKQCAEASDGQNENQALKQCAKASDRKNENRALKQSLAIAANNECVDKNRSLPFLKCSPLWKTIESIEVFHKTPQKPHFSPLLKCKDESREGLAIGYMVTFANVVERTSKLQISDPRSIIDSSLDTLVDLESHGFDVEAVRVWLNEMLLKKDREGQLEEELKEVESEIMKCNLEKAEFEKDITEIDAKMSELQDKRALASSMKEMKDKEIATLQLKRDIIGENICSAKLDFERLVASL